MRCAKSFVGHRGWVKNVEQLSDVRDTRAPPSAYPQPQHGIGSHCVRDAPGGDGIPLQANPTDPIAACTSVSS